MDTREAGAAWLCSTGLWHDVALFVSGDAAATHSVWTLCVLAAGVASATACMVVLHVTSRCSCCASLSHVN